VEVGSRGRCRRAPRHAGEAAPCAAHDDKRGASPPLLIDAGRAAQVMEETGYDLEGSINEDDYIELTLEGKR
jgi:hypothetical protein